MKGKCVCVVRAVLSTGHLLNSCYCCSMGRKCEWGDGQEGRGVLDASMWGLGPPECGPGWQWRGGSLYSQWVASVFAEGAMAGGYGGDMVGDRQVRSSEHGTSSLSEPMSMG